MTPSPEPREIIARAQAAEFVATNGWTEAKVRSFVDAHWEEFTPDSDRLLSALTAAGYEVVKGWQPIETAPQVLTAPEILVLAYGHCHTVTWDGCWSDEYGNDVAGVTHWRPLPAPLGGMT